MMQRLCAIFTLAILGGCSANHYSIFRHQQLNENSVTLIDAKQRGILAGAKPGQGTQTVQRFCAEPSPDVFAVVAQALSGGAMLEKSADPKALQVALTAAFSSSEQGSTIPRTQTINMLREVMYRTCERYLSGGIGELELPLQAIRDQRLIVSILAIEQLTGAVSPKPVVIGAMASASAGASNADAAIRLDDRFKDLQAKTGAEQARQKAYDDLNTSAKDCETIGKAVADNKADSLSDALKAKRPKCEAASAELATAKAQRAEAAGHYDMLAGIAKKGGAPGSSSASTMTPVATGGLDTARTSDVAEVAAAVQNIVAGTFEQDEFLFLCLKALAPGADGKETAQSKASTLAPECLKYVTSKLNRQTEENDRAALQARADNDKTALEQFNRFWPRVSTGDALDPAKVAALKQAVSAKDWPPCLDSSKDKAEAQACFVDRGKVVAGQRRALANGK